MIYVPDRVLNKMDENQLRDYVHLLHDVITKQSELFTARKDIINSLETMNRYKNYESVCNTNLIKVENVVEAFAKKMADTTKEDLNSHPTFTGTVWRDE